MHLGFIEKTMKKYYLKDRLKDSGFPTHNPFYQIAHRKAEKLEKQKFPTGYEKMKSIDAKLSKHELAGKNLRSGKIEVSKKVPKQYRKEVAYHERMENKFIKEEERKRKRR